MTARFSPSGEATTSRRGSFWVTGGPPVDGRLAGPLFVAWEAPAADAERPGPPWVLVHGGGGQGTDYTTTPDGRPGWSRLLVAGGRTAYVVDRPGHGRSPHHPDVLGALGPPPDATFLRSIFCPDGVAGHTQWPAGDAVFTQALAATGPMGADLDAMRARERDRIAELLAMVGPAVLVTHSAGGPGALAAADAAARDGHVAAVVAIEVVPSAVSGLTGLTGLPVAVVSAEASPLAAGDAALADELTTAGARVSHLRLGERGVHGNGHAMMLERNHAAALEVIVDWVDSAVGGVSPPRAGS